MSKIFTLFPRQNRPVWSYQTSTSLSLCQIWHPHTTTQTYYHTKQDITIILIMYKIIKTVAVIHSYCILVSTGKIFRPTQSAQSSDSASTNCPYSSQHGPFSALLCKQHLKNFARQRKRVSNAGKQFYCTLQIFSRHRKQISHGRRQFSRHGKQISHGRKQFSRHGKQISRL